MESPTYHDLGDHTETFQLEFDPEKISYAKLLDLVWSDHDPTEQVWSVQYKSVIFAANDEQEKTAKASRAALEKKLGRAVTTEIQRGWRFWLAEDYHQKYVLQSKKDIVRELRKVYPAMKDFVDSTAAARLNGWLAGHGDLADFDREIGLCGLSKTAEDAVRARMGRPASKTCGKGD